MVTLKISRKLQDNHNQNANNHHHHVQSPLKQPQQQQQHDISMSHYPTANHHSYPHQHHHHHNPYNGQEISATSTPHKYMPPQYINKHAQAHSNMNGTIVNGFGRCGPTTPAGPNEKENSDFINSEYQKSLQYRKKIRSLFMLYIQELIIILS